MLEEAELRYSARGFTIPGVEFFPSGHAQIFQPFAMSIIIRAVEKVTSNDIQ